MGFSFGNALRKLGRFATGAYNTITTGTRITKDFINKGRNIFDKGNKVFKTLIKTGKDVVKTVNGGKETGATKFFDKADDFRKKVKVGVRTGADRANQVVDKVAQGTEAVRNAVSS